MRRITLMAMVCVLVIGCGGQPQSEEEAVARVDAADGSCAALEDPVLLAHVFQFGGDWIRVDPADLVAAEIGRESHPQDRVIVDLPSVDYEAVSVRPQNTEVLFSNSTTIREDKFHGLEWVAPFGSGRVYVSLYKQGRDRPSSTDMFGWVDSAGDVHFLGRCGGYLWTEPLVRFAADIAWQGTQEGLLLALINEAPELQALHDWTWPP